MSCCTSVYMCSQRHMQKLVERAEQSLEAHSKGLGKIFRQQTDQSEPDALDVLGGRKSLIVSKSTNSSPNSMSASPDPSSSRRVSPTTPPAPMPSRAGAVEMLNKYYQEASSDHKKHDHYDYVPPQVSMTLSNHPQSLTQPQEQLTVNHTLYPPFPVPSNQNLLSSSNTLHAPPPPLTSGEVHPDYEAPHMYPPIQFWQQPHVSEHSHLQLPHPTGQNDFIMDFSTIPNGNAQFQPMQLSHHQSYSSEDVIMSQSDIWSNFASDFRP